MDEQTKIIIRATIPVLEQHSETITKHFYRNMFAEHPELRNIFNQSNQAKGTQPRALSNTIIAAAKNLDHLENLLPAVNLIAHKHVSLGVTKEQYPVVGSNLLKAIKEVLGNAATDEIIKAWETYYNILADIFIKYEEGLYHQSAEKYHWRGLKEFVVERKVIEGENICSFYLVPKDKELKFGYEPGQYVTICLKVGDLLHHRHYSLSGSPDCNHLRITVKKEKGTPDGTISNHLHDHVLEGHSVQLYPPAGDFKLMNKEKKILFYCWWYWYYAYDEYA
jgi:nitric oxide dioxygenase